MTIYNYNKETKEFISTSEARENPLEEGYLIPANSTTVKPTEVIDEGFAIVFNEGENTWEQVEDNRGIAYNVREEIQITELGPLKDGIAKEPVPFTQAELDKIEIDKQIAEAKQYLSDTDFKVLPDYDQDSTEVKVKRQEAREFIRANEGDN